jgi:ribosomal protein L19
MSGKHPLVQAVENAQLKQDIPAFAPGDTVIVQVKVKEGDRERLQAFEGVVIAKKNRGLNSAFTVREMTEARKVANHMDNYKDKAFAYEETVRPYLESIREHIDNLEMEIDDEIWPLPKYRELLFTK